MYSRISYNVQPFQEHVLPDAFSRHPVDPPQLHDLLVENDFSLHHIVASATWQIDDSPSGDTFRDPQPWEVTEVAHNDITYCLILQPVTDGFPFNKGSLTPVFRNCTVQYSQLSISGRWSHSVRSPHRCACSSLSSCTKSLHTSPQGIERMDRMYRDIEYIMPGVGLMVMVAGFGS